MKTIRNRRLRTVLMAGLGLAFSATTMAFAGSSSGSLISGLTIDQYGIGYFWTTQARVNAPSCSSPSNGRWAFNAASPTGQAFLALVTSASMSNKEVSIVGTGACSVASDSETVGYITVLG